MMFDYYPAWIIDEQVSKGQLCRCAEVRESSPLFIRTLSSR